MKTKRVKATREAEALLRFVKQLASQDPHYGSIEAQAALGEVLCFLVERRGKVEG